MLAPPIADTARDPEFMSVSPVVPSVITWPIVSGPAG